MHDIKKPTAWRGGAQIQTMKKKMQGCWNVVKQREKSGQRIGSVMRTCKNLEDRPWANEELKKSEEALPRLKECEQEKALRLYKVKPGVGCDGFHPKIPQGLDERNKRRNRRVLGKGGTKWTMAAVNSHNEVLLDSEEHHK